MFFHALRFTGSRGNSLNTRLLGPVFKHRSRGPASVNAMCSLFKMHILPDSNQKHIENFPKTLKYPFFTLDVNKKYGLASSFRTSLHRHNLIDAQQND